MLLAEDEFNWHPLSLTITTTAPLPTALNKSNVKGTTEG